MLAWLALAATGVLGCSKTPKQLLDRAEFGVLYGGQIQERNEVPFLLDTTKQTLGFSITLAEPTSEPLTVRWEVGKPGPRRDPNGPGDPLTRRTELFEAQLAPNQTQFNQTIAFQPGDALGMWNIRVTIGDQLAIDRPFMVYDPLQRRLRLREAQLLDGGV